MIQCIEKINSYRIQYFRLKYCILHAVYILRQVNDDIIRQTLNFLAIAIPRPILAEFDLHHAVMVWLHACPLPFVPSALFHSLPHSVSSQASITALLHIIRIFGISHSTVYQSLMEVFVSDFLCRYLCLFLTQNCYYFPPLHISVMYVPLLIF